MKRSRFTEEQIVYALQLALEVLRGKDTLVVWKLDRLGRSVKDLVTIVCDMEQRGVYFKSLTDQIDTSTPSSRTFSSDVSDQVATPRI